MKIKCRPEDFQVEEISQFAPGSGPFALYRLEKRGLGTLEAIAAVERRWEIKRLQIAFGGLKDRHAVSSQLVTIEHGPKRDLKQESFTLCYLGQAPRPYASQDITANRFRIVLRDLSPADSSAAIAALARLVIDGVPNYFDDQRFGSVGASGEFAAQAWCQGNFDRALYLAIAEENPRDRPDLAKAKAMLRAHWGRWREIRRELDRTPLAPYLTSLCRERPDLRHAIAIVPQAQRSLLLAAFQSAVWNEMLATLLREHCPAESLVEAQFADGKRPFPQFLADAARDEFKAALLPLPSARLHLEPGPTLRLIESVLAKRGMALREMRIKYPRDSFFSKGERSILFFPAELNHTIGLDELYPGRTAINLSFDLQRGSYATVLIRRLAVGHAPEIMSGPVEGE